MFPTEERAWTARPRNVGGNTRHSACPIFRQRLQAVATQASPLAKRAQACDASCKAAITDRSAREGARPHSILQFVVVWWSSVLLADRTSSRTHRSSRTGTAYDRPAAWLADPHPDPVVEPFDADRLPFHRLGHRRDPLEGNRREQATRWAPEINVCLLSAAPCAGNACRQADMSFAIVEA